MEADRMNAPSALCAGTHALYLAKLGYEVHSFEPYKTAAELLRCSAVANGFKNMMVVQEGGLLHNISPHPKLINIKLVLVGAYCMSSGIVVSFLQVSVTMLALSACWTPPTQATTWHCLHHALWATAPTISQHR
jgi:hypothetical protein